MTVRDERGDEPTEESFKHDGGITEFCEFLAPDPAVSDVLRLSGNGHFTETVPLLDDKGHMTPQDVERDLGVGQRDHSWGFRHWAGLHQWHWVTGVLADGRGFNLFEVQSHNDVTTVNGYVQQPEGTDYVAHVMHRNNADRNMHEELGFYDGWGTVVEQLATLVESRSRCALSASTTSGAVLVP